MTTPLWKVYLTKVASPIGITVAIILFVRTLVSATSMSPDEKAFGVECSIMNGTVETVENGATFCVKREKIELATPHTFAELCVEAGGVHKREIYLGDGDYADECWKYNIVQELGARHEYTANR